MHCKKYKQTMHFDDFFSQFRDNLRFLRAWRAFIGCLKTRLTAAYKIG